LLTFFLYCYLILEIQQWDSQYDTDVMDCIFSYTLHILQTKENK